MKKLRTEKEIISKWKGNIGKPLVSIGCITYNHEKYIRDALEGFLIQETDFPFQICILDDASTDDNVKIIKEYADEYPNLFKCFFLEENTWGKPYRLERAKPYLEARYKAKYIALCEGDDYWTDPYKLQKQVDFLEVNPDYALCGHRTLMVDDKGNSLGKEMQGERTNQTYTRQDLVRYGIGGHTSSLVMRNVEDFSTSKLHPQFKIYEYGNGYFFDEIMSCYRVHDGGIFSPTSEMSRRLWHLNWHTIQLIEWPEYKFHIKKRIKDRCINWLVLNLNRYKLKEFFTLWSQSFTCPRLYSHFYMVRILTLYIKKVLKNRMSYYFSRLH